MPEGASRSTPNAWQSDEEIAAVLMDGLPRKAGFSLAGLPSPPSYYIAPDRITPGALAYPATAPHSFGSGGLLSFWSHSFTASSTVARIFFARGLHSP